MVALVAAQAVAKRDLRLGLYTGRQLIQLPPSGSGRGGFLSGVGV